jgi:tetratricopeptide (TPR) repeat protein
MSSEPNWLEFFEDRERLHADYYLDFAQHHARRDPEAYEELEVESGNLLKTATWLAEQNEAEGILKLAEALWQKSDFIRTRGFVQRGLPLLEEARRAARQLGDTRAEFIWLGALADTQYAINPALTPPLYEQALTLAQYIAEPQLKAQAYLGMGRLQMDRGHLEQAAIWLKRSLYEYRQSQDHEGEIATLTALGNLLSLQGDSDGAVTYLEQGLPIVQAQQDRYGEAALRFALGYVAALAREWSKAIVHFEAATSMARSIGDRFLEVRGLHNLGEAWLVMGDIHQAVNLLEEALVRQETIDDVLTKAFTHFYLGKAYYILNDPERSSAQLRLVYIFREIPLVVDLATEAAWMEANNYLQQSKIDLARTTLHEVLNITPDYMVDLRQSAERLLEVIESGEYTMDTI